MTAFNASQGQVPDGWRRMFLEERDEERVQRHSGKFPRDGAGHIPGAISIEREREWYGARAAGKDNGGQV